MGSFTGGALALGFNQLVDSACSGAAARLGEGSKLSDQEKKGVEGLLCESMTFVAQLVTSRDAGAIEVGVHLATNGINLAKLTDRQQIYCQALKAEIALNAGKLAGVAATTYAAAVAGGHAGVVAGGVTGTMVAGPVGTVPGVVAGVAIGAGGPLLLGSYEMYETVARITDLAIDHHSQCGPLAMTKAPPARTATTAMP